MQKERLTQIAGENISFDCPMAPYTTFRVGGKGDAIFKAKHLDYLQQVMAYVNQARIPFLVVGRGSNLLVRDNGISGLVIMLAGALARIDQEAPNEPVILAGAGLPLSELLTYCRDRGYKGMEWAAGIPGTVGGAAIMNAGSFGKEIESMIKEIQVITPQGALEIMPRSKLRFSYRHLDMEEGYVIVRVKLSFKKDSQTKIKERMSDFLRRKKQSQPLEYPSAGSVFKNPPNDYAGRLVEEVGLKGKQIGGAVISNKHSNFIVNAGNAKAQDILDLMNLAQATVKQKTGIALEPEIRVVGN